MKINYIQKDIFEAFDNNEINITAHQTNCVSKNVGGYALYFFDKFPQIAEKHYKYIEKEDIFATNLYDIVDNKLLVNMYSQYYPGSPYNKKFLYKTLTYSDIFSIRCTALKRCLQSILELKFLKDNVILGIPLVASGIGAEVSKKVNMTDLEYFKMYIEPIVLTAFNGKNITINVYYL